MIPKATQSVGAGDSISVLGGLATRSECLQVQGPNAGEFRDTWARASAPSLLAHLSALTSVHHCPDKE